MSIYLVGDNGSKEGSVKIGKNTISNLLNSKMSNKFFGQILICPNETCGKIDYRYVKSHKFAILQY